MHPRSEMYRRVLEVGGVRTSVEALEGGLKFLEEIDKPVRNLRILHGTIRSEPQIRRTEPHPPYSASVIPDSRK
jgi:hypothetical protein